ncbi:hypothetical protein C0Q70_01340 [Pomacea canaliculata]|uniref:Transferrin receptor-like dimerisation domain-containing protein n=1 Tax=Pomacea canaliculata TaxID=400727 RepID=A0A2T7PZ83_POMCA|nr:hypothetical protein C0Q70_01340 [Pomacea canaliculata]
MYDPNKYPIAFYPLYHTEYETFDAMKRLIDPDFKYFAFEHSPMAIRMINDQLLFLEKAFLDSEGLPSRPQKKIFSEEI